MRLTTEVNSTDPRISTDERRRSKRYPVAKKVFLTFRPGFERMGTVKDFSEGGLCFEYLALRKLDRVEHVEVYIFSRSNNFYLSRIPCEVVYDQSKDRLSILKNAETRRCGLRFGQLSEYQSSSLTAIFKRLH
jgi:hypothetical protein